MVNDTKRQFLEDQFISLVRKIDSSTLPRWGKMNAQQMIEHVSGLFRISTDKLKFPLATPEELLPKYRAFLLSEREFRENTKAPMLPDEPMPLRYGTMNEAILDLDKQVKYFFKFF